jgi:glycoside/pentoside/hexuronide:cation symporter, GPH family
VFGSNSRDTQPQGSLRGIGVLYALPNVSMAMLWTPLNVMQGIYIKHYRFSMGLMATILLASRIYDAVADLAVGALSDWHKARSGQRKRMFAFGAVLFVITGLCVYIPPTTVGPLYLTFWLFAFFTGYAVATISHLAWGNELARISQQKTDLFSLRYAAGYAGLSIFYSIPLLPIFATTAITPQTIKLSAYVAALVFVPALILCLRFVPEGLLPTTSSRRLAVSAAALRALAANLPFRMLMGAYATCGLGLGVWYGMIFIFVDIYLKRGALFAPIYLAAFCIGALSSLVWNRVARRFGKKRTWAAGMILALATILATGLLNPNNTTVWSLGVLIVLNTIGLVTFELLPVSILGDVADYSMLKRQHNQAATYYSTYMFVTKILFALGSAGGLGLASWLGFDPRAALQTGHGILAINIVMVWLPAILLTCSIPLIQCIPMDERQHAIVRKRLEQRAARSALLALD